MPMSSLKAGVHYPGDLAAVRAWFPDDAACLDYLDWLRWSDGFRCTHCGCEKGWRLPAGGWSCAGCRKRVRVLAGTIFQDTRTPLTVWFEAAWLMAVTKNGVSAASLQPLLGLGSYETAWAMCHKLRTAMRTVSHEAIYRFVYALPAGELARHGVMLRSKRTRRRPARAGALGFTSSADAPRRGAARTRQGTPSSTAPGIRAGRPRSRSSCGAPAGPVGRRRAGSRSFATRRTPRGWPAGRRASTPRRSAGSMRISFELPERRCDFGAPGRTRTDACRWDPGPARILPTSSTSSSRPGFASARCSPFAGPKSTSPQIGRRSR